MMDTDKTETFSDSDLDTDGAAEALKNDSIGNEANGGYSAELVEPEEAERTFLGSKTVINYHLSDFDGPLDLLLTLIQEAKIDIEEIFVSDVTKQYVEIVTNTPKEELDFEYAGEFITMAAQLVYLKSVRALPKIDDGVYSDDDPEAEREALINKIREYALIKEKSGKLKELETVNRFYRAPVYTDKDYRVSLTNFSLPKLVDAFARILANAEKRGQEIIPKKVQKERFTVHDQMENIISIIALYKEISIYELFEPGFDHDDIVTTFLAVLELLKYGKMRAEQSEVFGEIMLYAVQETDGGETLDFAEDEDGEY